MFSPHLFFKTNLLPGLPLSKIWFYWKEACDFFPTQPSGKLTWLAGKSTWIESMYSLSENGIFQPAMLVYRRVGEQN